MFAEIYSLFLDKWVNQSAAEEPLISPEKTGAEKQHTNNWAVLVCSSRYWFNYRHMANTLGMYRTVKRLGIPDSQIILMLADDVACNPRNTFPGTIYANKGKQLDLYGSGVDSAEEGGVEGVEVDYRGYQVNVENFLRVLTGRLPPHMPPSKHLLSDASSNIFVYLTGHGGDGFLKFQDNEEIGARDLGDAIGQMWEKKRYNKMMVMIDTCQANTLYASIYSPNVLATGSSELGENSYSHHNDMEIGVAVIDSFTHYVLQYLEGIQRGSNATMQDFFDIYDPDKIKSHPGIRKDLFPHDLRQTLVTDFFGGVAQVETTHNTRGNDTTQWDDSLAEQEPVLRDQAMLDVQDTSLSNSTLPGHDLRAPMSGPKQDWIVLVVLVGLLWVLQRRALGFRRGGAQGKAKVE